MLGGIVRTMRPRQWVKNVFVLAPVIFAQELFDVPRVLGAGAGFVCFSLLASAVYILNDLVDVEADRAHPVKRRRPIASGAVSPSVARSAIGVLVLVSLVSAWFLSPMFLLVLVGYLVNNIAYTFGMKRIAYLDVISIAAGFELRVLAGSIAADVPPSAYLLIVTFMLASFLGLGKRMHELVQQANSGTRDSRPVLRRYSRKVVNAMAWVTGTVTITTYCVYTLDPHTRAMFGTDLLVLTTGFACVGVLRFLYLVKNRPDAESPTEEMLRDVPFLATGILGALTTIAIIYFS